MNVFRHFADRVAAAVAALQADGSLPAGLDLKAVAVEPPRDAAHGDLATNAAMVLARSSGKKPRDLAELLAAKLRADAHVTEVSIAGPGFINLRLDDGYWRERLADALAAGAGYGDSAMGGGRKVNVEYVSANPTGPLTVGHARGAIFGDVLATLLAKAGWDVTREYYINDAGAQVDTLARSAYLRYREANGALIGEIPEGLYPGEYLKDVGVELAKRDGQKWMQAPESDWLPVVRPFAVAQLMELIKADLGSLGIAMDVYTSERALVEAGAVEAAFRTLSEAGLIYVGRLPPPKGEKAEDWEDRDQTLFRSTQFGDDVDRPMKKSDGSWTYFANDIANHLDKFRRGYAHMIDVWGADHGGYVKRMQAAVKAVTNGEGRLDVELCQIVRLMRRGELVRMSKRSGNFVTLRDLVEEAGAGVARFLILTRENKTQLDFDLEKALEQSKDNMVWYVQYAHARTCSVMRQAADANVEPAAALRALAGVDGNQSLAALLDAARPHLGRLVDSGELALMRQIAGWPRQVELAAEHHEPHRLAFYLYELASQLHAHWNRGKDEPSLRFIVQSDADLTLARLALVKAVGVVIQSGLAVFGVSAMQEMR